MRILLSALITINYGLTLIKQVAEQRGYFAIGGEWIALIFIGVVTYIGLGEIKTAYQKLDKLSRR